MIPTFAAKMTRSVLLTTILLVSFVYADYEPVDTIENVIEEATKLGGVGWPASQPRIVSGWPASDSQFPWQVSLRMTSAVGGASACGGSVIHHEWAITAAHCTALRVSVIIRAGLTNLTRPEYIFETYDYFNHPEYDNVIGGVQPSDIALLKFNRYIPYGDFISPLRLQSSDDKDFVYAGMQLIASGYGRTWTDGVSPENLHWVYLRGMPNEECYSTYGQIIVNSTICALFYNVTSQSTCQGDSGGPLIVLEKDGAYSMIGVSSFVAAAGCHAILPAGFIRPGHYHDWFEEVTGINLDWTWPVDEEIEVDSGSSVHSAFLPLFTLSVALLARTLR